MGSLCSRSSAVEESYNGEAPVISPGHEAIEKGLNERFSPTKNGGTELSTELSQGPDGKEQKRKLGRLLSDRARTAKSKTSTAAKKGAQRVSEVIGRAGTAGIGKAVEALDTFGSTITNLGGGFATGVAPKGNKIGVLAFEVANTIVKGSNLKQSLSEEDVRILKEETLVSEGVQRLVSQDVNALLQIAAADKRKELNIFAREVVRFGNKCRDPQWHSLDRVFNKLGREMTIPSQSRDEADAEIHNLMTLAQHTAELYHELHTLDRFQTELRRKMQEEESFSGPQRGMGETVSILKNELRQQQKHVKNLKRRSLWSKILEEVMEQLVDIVYYLHQELQEAFGSTAFAVPLTEKGAVEESSQKLGASGLALHYANIINQIDNLVLAQPNSVPANTRDSLYQGLPPSMKASLRNQLQVASYKDELTANEIREEMEKILEWLVPIAANTTKAHHGFGWVGEWASTGSANDRRQPGHTEVTLLQTLHHANQLLVEEYILELIVGLHHLVSRTRSTMNGHRSPLKSPIRSPTERKGISAPAPQLPPSTLASSQFELYQQTAPAIDATDGVMISSSGQRPYSPNSHAELSQEDMDMLKEVEFHPKCKKYTPGISKSQEFKPTKMSGRSTYRLIKSNSHSPSTTTKAGVPFPIPVNEHKYPPSYFVLEFENNKKLDIDRLKDLDVVGKVGPAAIIPSSIPSQCS